jgi:hypothetical protein
MRLTFALLIIVLLAACAPGEEPPSPVDVEATVNASVAMTMEAQGQIATSVAMTVAAQETEAARALPTATLVPPQPLPTLTPILPTATSFAVTPSSGGGGGGGGGGSTTYEYSCDIIRQRPRDNTEFMRAHTFDVSFAILNNGTATWDAGKDLVLLGNPGNALTVPPGIIELPKMEPGDVFTVGPFDAVAPDEPGRYVIDFKLEGGFCYPYVAFYVVR